MCLYGKPPRSTCVVALQGVGVFPHIKIPSRFLGNSMLLNNALLRSEVRTAHAINWSNLIRSIHQKIATVTEAEIFLSKHV